MHFFDLFTIKVLYFALVAVAVVAMFRITILYYQTFGHLIWTPSVTNKVWWILGHIFLGPFVSVPYYYKHRIE